LGDELIQAAEYGSLAEVKRLLEEGAVVNRQGEWGLTALMNAASGGAPAESPFLLRGFLASGALAASIGFAVMGNNKTLFKGKHNG
jgi:ankyrin repeat protein